MARIHTLLSGLQLLSLDNYECTFFQTGNMSLKKEGLWFNNRQSMFTIAGSVLRAACLTRNFKSRENNVKIYVSVLAPSSSPLLCCRLNPRPVFYHWAIYSAPCPHLWKENKLGTYMTSFCQNMTNKWYIYTDQANDSPDTFITNIHFFLPLVISL